MVSAVDRQEDPPPHHGLGQSQEGIGERLVEVVGEKDAPGVRTEIKFDSYGELYLCADAGRIFFPHDFYQPLANAFLGLTEPMMRRRIFLPVHRGNHGYLPDRPSEKGYVVLLDSGYRVTRREAELIDFAPSVLTLLDHPKPATMKGSALF